MALSAGSVYFLQILSHFENLLKLCEQQRHNTQTCIFATSSNRMGSW